MNPRALSAMLLAGAGCIGLPAAADDDRARFLREMARTDGNPHGDLAIPLPARSDVSRLTPEQVAFFREMARTDGNATVEPAPTAEENVASR